MAADLQAVAIGTDVVGVMDRPGAEPQHLAFQFTEEAKTLEAQIDRALQLVWLRPPSATERREFAEFARSQGLPALCRLLLNSNEFLFVN